MDESEDLARIAQVLKSVGLDRYFETFKKNELDWETFLALDRDALARMNVPVGTEFSLISLFSSPFLEKTETMNVKHRPCPQIGTNNQAIEEGTFARGAAKNVFFRYVACADKGHWSENPQQTWCWQLWYSQLLTLKDELPLKMFVFFKGDVYEGTMGDTLIAAKELRDETKKEEFYREAATLEALRNPNLITFYGIFDDRFMIMEKMDTNLRAFLMKNRDSFNTSILLKMFVQKKTNSAFFWVFFLSFCF
jgi:serine/threonine protein kinase